MCVLCCQDMKRVVTDMSHVQRVRRLYKLILRLHRGLPTEMKSNHRTEGIEQLCYVCFMLSGHESCGH